MEEKHQYIVRLNMQRRELTFLGCTIQAKSR